MRITGILAGLAAVLAATPAHADITAHYQQGEGQWSRQVVIEANDRGDCRVDSDPAVTIVLGGVIYFLQSDAAGDYVARLDDLIAEAAADIQRAVEELGPVAETGSPGNGQSAPAEDFPASRGPPSTPARVQVIQGVTETVGGRRGTLWTIRHPASPVDGRDEEFVVSMDPDLVPLACALPVLYPRSTDPGDDPTGATAARLDIQRQGMIIRDGRDFRLQRIDTRPIPPSHFALPSRPLTREQLEARHRSTGSR